MSLVLIETYQKIIAYQAEGRSGDWIADKLGYSKSEYLDACAYIAAYRQQQEAVPEPIERREHFKDCVKPELAERLLGKKRG